jgi:hypothetical protein
MENRIELFDFEGKWFIITGWMDFNRDEAVTWLAAR